MQFNKYEDLIGKRVLHSVLDTRGTMLIPDGTILLKTHVEKLEKFGIDLFDIHVESVDKPSPRPSQNDTCELVKHTEVQLQEIENFIQMNGQVPIAIVEEKVLPAIWEATKTRNLFQLFSDLKATGDFRYRQSIGVAVMATMLGKWLQLEEGDMSLLTTAASLYDIGSLKLPSSLFHNSSRYLPHEQEIMKKHTVLGYELLKESGLDHRVALVALQHHEREDGSGYPSKLKGDQIDRLSKIVAIADVYVAMTSERPHRPAFAFFEVINEIYKGIIENRFNSVIGLTFLNKLMSAQIGSEVILTDGRRGKIMLINANYPTSPLISIDDDFIDLSKTNAIKLKEVIG